MRTLRSLVWASLIATALVGEACSTVPAAAAGSEWRTEAGDELSALTVDPAGKIYVTGTVYRPRRGERAMVIAKFDPAGRQLWRHTWRRQRPGWWADGSAIVAVPGGGVVVGVRSGYAEGNSALLFRYSASGRRVWSRSIFGTYVTSLAADAQGIVASVDSWGPSEPCADHDGRVLAFDRAGRPIWETDFEVPGIVGTHDSAGGLALGADGRVYVAGHVDRAGCDPEGPSVDEDIVIQQLTRGGRPLWSRVLGDGLEVDQEGAHGVAVRSGLVAVVGSVDGTGMEQRAWLGVFGTDGERRWVRRWGLADDWSVATAVSIAPWGPIYVGSYRQTDPNSTDRPGTSVLRRYALDGTLVRVRRVATEVPSGPMIMVSAIATSDVVYLTVASRLECWPR